MSDTTRFTKRADPPAATASATTIQKWGGLASFLMVGAAAVSGWIYLSGDLRAAHGPATYEVADLLYGPVWAASLVMAVYALRERIGERAPQRMTLALLAALLAAETMVGVACFRSANRHYHLLHPELHLEASTEVLVVWGTVVAGMIAAGWHFLGWSYVLLGWSGWTSRRLPAKLSALYLASGTAAWFVYLVPGLEAIATLLVVVASLWLGTILWRAEMEYSSYPVRVDGAAATSVAGRSPRR
jgi:hypothetical protein